MSQWPVCRRAAEDTPCHCPDIQPGTAYDERDFPLSVQILDDRQNRGYIFPRAERFPGIDDINHVMFC